jgi:hypothetical protein
MINSKRRDWQYERSAYQISASFYVNTSHYAVENMFCNVNEVNIHDVLHPMLYFKAVSNKIVRKEL